MKLKNIQINQNYEFAGEVVTATEIKNKKVVIEGESFGIDIVSAKNLKEVD